MDESGMIKTQMGMHNRSEMITVLGTPCVISSCDRNSKSNSNTLAEILFEYV
jgi:hypothetical protein